MSALAQPHYTAAVSDPMRTQSAMALSPADRPASGLSPGSPHHSADVLNVASLVVVAAVALALLLLAVVQRAPESVFAEAPSVSAKLVSPPAIRAVVEPEEAVVETSQRDEPIKPGPRTGPRSR